MSSWPLYYWVIGSDSSTPGAEVSSRLKRFEDKTIYLCLGKPFLNLLINNLYECRLRTSSGPELKLVI